MNKLTVMLLCLMLCLTGTASAEVSAEQSGVTPAAPPSTLTASSQRVVSFTPAQTSRTFLSLLADMSIDVIELDGTYHLPYVLINVDRTSPVLIQPAAGATVIFSGTCAGTDPQFGFGFAGTAGNITMHGLIFDGFILGQQGIVCALNCHDIALNDIVVRNSRADTRYAQPYHSWALYLSSTATACATNFTANNWTVDGSARGMSALQVYGGDHVTATGWSVSDTCYAVFASSIRGSLRDFVLDNWTISGTKSATGVSIYVENTSGLFSNIRTTGSGFVVNIGRPRLTDRGGNSVLVLRMGSVSILTRQSF